MKTAKDALFTRMIAIYGFEHPETIRFAELIDLNMPFTFLLALVRFHEALPQQDEDDGDC